MFSALGDVMLAVKAAKGVDRLTGASSKLKKFVMNKARGDKGKKKEKANRVRQKMIAEGKIKKESNKKAIDNSITPEQASAVKMAAASRVPAGLGGYKGAAPKAKISRKQKYNITRGANKKAAVEKVMVNPQKEKEEAMKLFGLR